MKVIAIVGASKRSFINNRFDDVLNRIANIIKEEVPFEVISGGADGVDTIVKRAHPKTREIKPAVFQWLDMGNAYGYRSRNMMIAEQCDKLYNVVMKDEMSSCYHCDKMGHKVSGGCWTMNYAKSIGKEVEIIVV